MTGTLTGTLHVVPVGISLPNRVEAGELPALEHALRPAADQVAANTGGPVRALLRSATAADGRLATGRLLDDRQRRQLRLAGGEELSAEWSTVRAARSSQPTGEDAVVLIATDTDEGLRAGLLVAARYADEVCYLDSLGDGLPPPVELGGVYLCRAPGLNLARPGLDAPVWQGLGRIGRLVAHDARHADRQVIFHLSGGYKAVIPYLMVMAETVRSVVCDEALTVPGVRSTVSAVALHESARQPVDIPVRRWPARSWRLVKELAADSSTVLGDRYDDLLGLLVERDGQRRTRTRYGWIMVSVL